MPVFHIKDKNKDYLDKIKVRRNRNENEKIDLQRGCPRLALTLLPVIEYSNKIYDKIIYLNISDNEIHFENKEDDSITNNIACKLNEVKITLE